MSELRKVRVQHAERQADGSILKEDVDIYTDAEAISMDGKALRERIIELINIRIEELIDGAPEELDTLNEIADELSANQSSVSTILNMLNSCAKTKDIPKNLSDLTEDETHRTVTAAEKKRWNNKVDMVFGKGLSTNDFTDAMVQMLRQANYKSQDNYQNKADKTALEQINANIESVYNQLNAVKVEKVEGKGLSTNDYTNADKEKVASFNADYMRNIVLTEAEYSALSDNDKNRSDTLYFIKE